MVNEDKASEGLMLVAAAALFILILILIIGYAYYRREMVAYQDVINDNPQEISTNIIPRNYAGLIETDSMDEYADRAVFISMKDGRRIRLDLDFPPNYSFAMPSNGTKINVLKPLVDDVQCTEVQYVGEDERSFGKYSCAIGTWNFVRVKGNQYVILNGYFPAVSINSETPGGSYIEEKIIYGLRKPFLNLFEFIAIRDQETNEKTGFYMIRKAQTNFYLSFKESIDYSGRSQLSRLTYTQGSGTEFMITGSPVRYEPFASVRVGTMIELRGNGDYSIVISGDEFKRELSDKEKTTQTIFSKAITKKFQNGRYTGYGVRLKMKHSGVYMKLGLQVTSSQQIAWTTKINDGSEISDGLIPQKETFLYIGRSPDNRTVVSGEMLPGEFFTLSCIYQGEEFVSSNDGGSKIIMKRASSITSPFQDNVERFFDGIGFCIMNEFRECCIYDPSYPVCTEAEEY